MLYDYTGPYKPALASDELLTSSIGTPNDLRSGLYLALPLERDPNEVTTYQAYIVYWPEDSTWDDAAISSIRRNRVTFMRLVYSS